MRTVEGLLALSRVSRPNQFSLGLERTRQRPQKVPAEVIAVPYFLDEVEEVAFVCPRCGSGSVPSSRLETAVHKLFSTEHEEVDGFLLELPKAKTL